MKLSMNVCGPDRVVRIVVGAALAAAAYFGILTGVLATIAYIVAAIALLTGFGQICPINQSLGINTCRPKHST